MLSSFIIRKGIQLQAVASASARKELSESAKISFGRHFKNGENREVIRFQLRSEGKTKWVEVPLSSKKGRQLYPVAKRKEILRKMVVQLTNDRRDLMLMMRSLDRGKSASDEKISYPYAQDVEKKLFLKYTYEEFCSLVEKHDQSISAGYRYGRHVFRSKSEMLVAQLLDQLGLEYKYEPVIMFKDEERWPDFAVYCPETGRYFFIEHLGMMDHMKYRMDNMEKMALYEEFGIRNGVDIIYTTEFGRGSFDVGAVMGKIAGIVIAQSHS